MRVVSFSGGRSSAYMLYMELQKPTKPDLVVFANTGKEHPATLDFVRDCGAAWGVDIVWLEYDPTTDAGFRVVDYDSASRTGAPYDALVRKKLYLPNQSQRFCTLELKVVPIKKYIKSLGIDLEDVEMLVAIRHDEPRRYFTLKDSTRNGYMYKMPLYMGGGKKGQRPAVLGATTL